MSCVYGQQFDIWYRYTPTQTGDATISLCGSDYDTGLALWSACGGTELACNDDFCGLQSEITYAVTAGVPIYVQVGGYNGATGNVLLNIYFAGGCVVECPPGSIIDPEPDVYTDYEDTWNGGCNSVPPVFGAIDCNTTLCGTTGWYTYLGSDYRDTDWYILDLVSATDVTATFESEVGAYLFFLLDPAGDCSNVTVQYQVQVVPCVVGTLSATLDPALGSWYVWVGPDVFTGTGGDHDFYVTLDCVNQGGPLDGTLTYFNNGTPMDIVEVSASTGGVDMTDASGYYGPMSTPDGPATLSVDHSKPWETFNTLDVLILRQYLATGSPALVMIQLMAADVTTGTGVAVNTLDALIMRQELANQNPPAYLSPLWLYYDTDVTVAGPTTHDFEAIMSGDVNGSNIPDAYVPPPGIFDNPCGMPYPINSVPTGPIPGSTIGAADACPGWLGFPQQWAAIDCPNATQTVWVRIEGAALDNAFIVGTTVQCSCVDTDYIFFNTYDWQPPAYFEATFIVPGPSTFHYPIMTGTTQDFTFYADVY
jgi:hypothetical protein